MVQYGLWVTCSLSCTCVCSVLFCFVLRSRLLCLPSDTEDERRFHASLPSSSRVMLKDSSSCVGSGAIGLINDDSADDLISLKILEDVQKCLPKYDRELYFLDFPNSARCVFLLASLSPLSSISRREIEELNTPLPSCPHLPPCPN